MLQTSDIYKQLLAEEGSIRVTKAIVNGVEYSSGIRVCNRQRSLFSGSTLSFGGCYSSSIELSFLCSTDVVIPKNAEVRLETKLVSFDRSKESEWIPQGTYYISKRSGRGVLLTLTCYDAIMKTGVIFVPQEGDIGDWPRKMPVVAKQIFDRIGVEIDPRTEILDYDVEFPNDLTEREILGYIAAAHGANWIMTLEDKAWMVPYGVPQDTIDLENSVSSIEPSLPFNPISKVVMYYEDNSEDAYVAGDSDSQVVYAMCPWATQEMVDQILSRIKGNIYRPYQVQNAPVDPSAELGDTVVVGGQSYLLITQDTTFSSIMLSNLEAPCDQAPEEEFDYMSPSQVQAYREKKRVDTTIERNTDNILLAVKAVEDNLGGSLDGLENQVSSDSDRITELEKSSEFTVTKDEVSIIISTALSDGVDSVRTKTGFTFDDEGMTVSKSGTQMTTQVTENGVYVRRRDTNMLTATAEGVTATNLSADTYLIIGGKARLEKYGTNRIGCFWIGG